ncbi:MAG TPA: DUF5990 family protein [Longimicrobium sp.]|nr:DUF5990 family protein [Longimicrobium sp.]
MQPELPLRVTVLRPPAGVAIAMQKGRNELVPPSCTAKDGIAFDFTVRVADPSAASPNFLGPFAQGKPGDRFVYVNSGTSAGQAGSCWSRRAKVKLGGITREMVEAALREPGAVLEARFEGVGRDGGPSCATVPLLDGGWRLVRGGG